MEHHKFSNKYGTINIPATLNKTNIYKTLQEGKPYEEETIEFILAHANGKNIVHAGAYIGDMLPAFKKLPGKVFAFEPISEYYKTALHNSITNEVKNARLTPAALTNSIGLVKMVKMVKEVRLGGCAHIVSDDSVDAEYVIGIKLDDLSFINNVGIIHLDVENHESSALMGASRVIRENMPILLIETKDDTTAKGIEEGFLKGYKIVDKINDNYVFVPKNR